MEDVCGPVFRENGSIVTACYNAYPTVLNTAGFLLKNGFGPPQLPPEDSKQSSSIKKRQLKTGHFTFPWKRINGTIIRKLNLHICYFYKIDA